MFPPVLVTPPAGDIVTLTEIKRHCRVDHNDDDTVLEGLVRAAVAHLDGWSGILGRCLLTQVWRQPFQRWADVYVLAFPNVASVVITFSDSDGVNLTVADSMYRLIETSRGTAIEFASDFDASALQADCSDPVRVAMTAGYGTVANVPEPIKVAIKMMVAHWYEHREAVSDRMEQLPLAADVLLAPYRRVLP